MLVRNPWPAEAGRFGALVALGALLGLIGGQLTLGILLAVAFYLGTQVRNLVRLERWLRQGRRLRPPESQGLWGTIFDNLYRLQRRHRQRRQRLAELLRRVKESANAMPDATVVLAGAGHMLWWNRLATEYLGLQWPRDQGQRIVNLLRHPEFSEYMREGDWQDAIKVPSPVSEQRVLEIRIVPYGLDQKLLLAREVSRLHRLETMRRDFVGNITHELRTPLTVIRGMAENLDELADGDGDGQLARGLGLIQQQTRRMGRLVDDLLLLSRLETAERAVANEPVNVAGLVEGLRDEAEALSEGRHEITADADATLVVRGDEGELRSAFSNLVVNAIKYTPAGGHVDIRWFEAGNTACLSVADTGPGIPAHHLPRLTERFYRVDSGRASGSGGTGLGLAIAKHVLSRHGARLDVTSQVEEGSTFTCVFSDYHHTAVAASGASSGAR